MDVINVSDLKKLIATAHATLCVVIHALDTKVLIGEINRPLNSPPKIKRKRRTKKEMALNATAGHIKMDLEKEYQADRTSPILSKADYKANSEANTVGNLPDADKGKAGEFFKKKREKKEPVEQ